MDGWKTLVTIQGLLSHRIHRSHISTLSTLSATTGAQHTQRTQHKWPVNHRSSPAMTKAGVRSPSASSWPSASNAWLKRRYLQSKCQSPQKYNSEGMAEQCWFVGGRCEPTSLQPAACSSHLHRQPLCQRPSVKTARLWPLTVQTREPPAAGTSQTALCASCTAPPPAPQSP